MAEKKYELKPCAHCGGRVLHWYCTPDGHYISRRQERIYGRELTHHLIRCEVCGIRTKPYSIEFRAAKAWNRRANEND